MVSVHKYIPKKVSAGIIVCLWAVLAFLCPKQTAAQCNASFAFPNDTVCSGQTVPFTNSSTGSGTLTYLWNFGDASSPSNFSNAQHPSHSYIDSGHLVITLIVTDGSACSDTLTDSIYIIKSPDAAFTRYDNCKQTVTKFSNNSTTTAGDAITAWRWFFGNGDSSHQTNPNYTYSDTGTFSIKLIVGTVGGCADTVTQSLRVYSKPQISVGDTQFCAGTSVNFNVAITETSGASFLWRLGDGNSSILQSPLYTYNTGGYYKPRVRVTHGGTDSCFAQFDSITVQSLPIANFVVANDTLCFEGNNACITDSSKQGTFGAPIWKRTLVFGDGFLDNTTPISTKTICHSYSDDLGGSYPITIEVTDFNNCFASKQVSGAVVVLPDYIPVFTVTETKDCFTTHVTLNNTSPFDSSKIRKFRWVFGDGGMDSSNWIQTEHLYTTNGNYPIQLITTDTSGCPKTTVSSTSVQSTVLNFNPTVNRDTSCYYGNSFTVNNPVNIGTNATWDYGDGSTDTSWLAGNSYGAPGNYVITLRIQAPNCDTLASVRTVTVLGPRASIGTPLNRYQCQIHDTVVFSNTTSNPYLSNHGPAPGNIKRIWDFKDTWAPACTTDTKNGINVGMNCNYSVDSINVKHWYTPGKEACYRPMLILHDTVWGCSDSNSVDLALLPPKAGPDPSATPPITGLVFNTPDCLGPETSKSKSLSLSLTRPACDRETFWVMWDSTCAEQSGNFNANWIQQDFSHNYQYTSPPCDTGGRVTLGLIIRNGRDSTGTFCYDTAWYHNAFQFNDLYPSITHDFDPTVSRCVGTTVNFRVTDTTQTGITDYSWNFSDVGTSVNGSTMFSTSHTFDSAGTFDITLTMTNADGCQGSASVTINIGFGGDFDMSPKQVCVDEPITFFDSIYYFDNGLTLWRTPARHAANKETVWWDFGDGNGFSTGGWQPTKTFTKAGTYSVRLALKDSSGCRDTITHSNIFTVYGTYADIGITDTLVCPQVYQLIDSTKIYDPLNYISIPTDDSAVSWKWTIMPGSLKSTIKNPFFDFPAGGDYSIKLVVENTLGCKDSIEKQMNVKGPVPAFSIVGDSLGCSPLLITFSNQTINANKYIWNFRDANNSTLTTLSDSNVFNVYTGGGLYKPYLTAESSEYDSKQGRTVTCRAVFPDTAVHIIRLIAVSGTPLAAFGNTNACSSFSLNFTDSSTLDSGTIVSHFWDFGDGATSTQQNPSHSFADTGTYTVTLIVTASSGCADTMVKNIAVAPPPSADFVVQNTCHGNITQFTDSSSTSNAYVVRWDWDFGDLTTSVLSNPSNQYVTSGTYPVKLKILTNAGCEDSVIKNVSINPVPVVSFVAPATCAETTVAFVNNSSISSGTATYIWKFGNGNASILPTPTPSYNTHGTYTVWLIATSDSSCKDSTSQVITIHPRPVPSFSINDSDQCININSFVFTNGSSIPSGTFTSEWNFGDGNSTNTASSAHIYADTGRKTVFLTETSDFGCKRAIGKNIYVFPKPTAGFTINDTAQCINTQSFVFTNTSTDTGAFTSNWSFTDATTATSTDVTKTFANDIYYTARLVVTNGNLCRDTTTRDIHVLSKPNPVFTINDTGQCVNNNLYVFTNTTTINNGSTTALWRFGDGITGTAFDENHSYTYDTGYTVKLIATSDRGCLDSTTRTLTVFPKPFPKFTANDSDQCLNINQYTFTNQTTLKYGTNTYGWNYGDGSTGTTTAGSRVYALDGDYTVTLTATSDNGCIDSSKKQITVFPVPNSAFTINDATQCLNTNSFAFTNTSTTGIGTLKYDWFFGSGHTSKQADTTFSINTVGVYLVRLIVENIYGCFDTSLTQFETYPVPVVQFAINDTDQCSNINNFVFTNQSNISAGTLTYRWEFGTEGTSTQTHPSFVFANDITHNVKLKATSNQQCSDSLIKQIIVLPTPVANFNINDTGQCVNGNKYDYTNQTTLKYGTLTYNWDFDNGKTSTATDTSIVYAAYGKYQPVLIATSNFNCRDTITKDISVYAKPTPAFNINDTDQCLTGNSFVMSNQSQIAEGVMGFEWFWGDGGSSTQLHPNRTYAKDSTYTIKLLVTSNWSCKDSISKQIVVFPQPQIAFIINDSGQCVNNNQFQFTNGSVVKYGSMTYNWNFGNGKTSVAIDTAIVYTYDSTFRVVLRATTNNGCTDTGGRYVIVHSKPTPAFATNDTDQCVNNNLYRYTNQTTIKLGSNTYDWDFGNGTTDTATHPVKVYTYDTTYRVRLLATSNFGCVDSISKTMLVFPKPQAAYIVNDSSQCINTNNYIFTNQSVIKYGTLTYAWDYGNGNGSTTINPTYVYPVQGTFIVSLIPRSNNNCYDTALGTSILFPKPNPDFVINDTAQCLFEQDFFFKDTSTIDSGTFTHLWRFSDGTSYDSVNIRRQFNNPGTYSAELVLTSDELCMDSITKNVVVYPHPNPNFTGLKLFYCTDDDSLPLQPLVAGGIFTGKNMRNDTFVPRYTGADTVFYRVQVNGCYSDTEKYTKVFPLPSLSLPLDTTLCKREFLILNAQNPNATYLWSTGSTEPRIRVAQQGLYKVTLFNICDTITDSVYVTFRDYDCNFFFPTAFTPNGDGQNDMFLPYMEDVIEFNMKIFTRWGELIFESNDKTKGWDGSYKGEPLQDGVYVWKIFLKIDESGEVYNHSTGGNVTLLR